jgi:Malectin-like domain
VSIDCGLSGTPSYVDSSVNLTYVSDEQFIDTGINSQISSSYGDNYPREYLTLRSFPSGIRNCYTIKSLIKGSSYLVRTIFFYANYDNLNKAPKFDVYLGASLWTTVNADSISFPEIIFSATADYLDVCLVNTNHGVPFITSIHLRQFDKGMYPYVTSRTSLILVERYDMGASSLTRSICMLADFHLVTIYVPNQFINFKLLVLVYHREWAQLLCYI